MPPPPDLTACALCAGDTLGSADRLPGGQLARLRDLAERGVVRLTEVECLDVCEEDVVVVRPAPAAHRAGARPVWMSRVAGERLTAELAGWLASGGPGGSPVPERLRPCVVRAVEGDTEAS